MTSKGHQTTFFERLVWGCGGLTEALSQTVFSLSFSIFSIGLGVSPALIGTAKALPRLFDAFTDPVMGNISDNTHTRWGRRRPFILLGALLIGVIYPLIWMPNRNWSELGLFAWFVGFTILFFIGFTVWSIPWAALGLELSDDYNDRTRIQVFRMVFATVGGMALSWAYKLCFFFNTDEVIGVRTVGWIVGLVMMAAGITSVFFIKEWRPVDRQQSIRLVQSMKVTLSNRPFLLLCGTVLFFAAGFMITDPLQVYVNIYYVYDGDREATAAIMALSTTLAVLLSLIVIPMGGRLSEKLGKRRTTLLALACIIVGRASMFWLVTPVNPYLQIISRLAFHPANMLMWALVPSMIADVCDADELETGRRREAAFSAVYQWILKFGGSIAMVLSGVLLSAVGAKVASPDAMLPEEVVFKMRLLLALLPALMGVASFVCVWWFPLTEQRVREIKTELESKD